MLLKSIKLHNFRQFRDESLDFAQGNDGKNVTIIIGENASGKTTFAQAFFWCMYGETSFSDKVILNKTVAKDLCPGREEKVSVTLSLRHGEVEYTFIREQSYRKDNNNNVKGDNTVFNIAMKDANGVTKYVKSSQCEAEVNGILPKELSKYFFFDGERIDKMSKDISSSKRSTDFAEAVNGLLGLNGYLSAMEHFSPKRQKSVISSYDSSFDAKSNAKILDYTSAIEGYKEQISELEEQLQGLKEEIESAKQHKTQKTLEIRQYEEGKNLLDEKDKILTYIKNTEKARAQVYKAICKDFNSSMRSFFSVSLMHRALRFLAQEDFTGLDIPFIRGETIEFLLKRKTCICGTPLEESSTPYDTLKELIKYLPPQTMSNMVAEFKREARRRIADSDSIVEQVSSYLGVISSQNDDITDKNDDLQKIEKKLSGGDVRATIRSINEEIRVCEKTIHDREEQVNKYNREIGVLIEKKDRADTERRQLTNLDENNRRIEIYKAYAERIYTELCNEYSANETRIREKLQNTINDIFKQLYDGGLYLTIDDKYRITVYANDYEGNVETSTAQSISVIFAFITSIIKIARDNRNSNDSNANLLSSEPYPLVMDAPLSSFDTRRIKSVCEALPKTAEQVIIFIKDTDGELAENHMGEKIGSRHSFRKINEFETVLE